MPAQFQHKFDNTGAGLNLSGMKVLVIEDELLIAMFIEEALSDIGCETVDIASNLDEAMKKSAEQIYDFVTMDVNLAGKQSFALADILWKRQLPFIFCTGYGDVIIPPHLKHVPLLQKPFRDFELKEKINSAITMNRA